jgi:hypothetical protein
MLQFIHIPTNLHDAYNAISNRAVDKMGDNIFHYYVVKYLVPGMVKNGCTTTRRTKSCADVSGKTNIVTANFRAWRDANIEGKLAEKGIEFRIESTGSGNRVYVTSKSLRERIDLGTFTGSSRDFEGKAFAQLRGKKEFNRELRRATKDLTLREKMYVWAIAKPIVGRKYGPRYCIVACQTRKKIKATKQELITLARGVFFQRVITPLNTSIGTALECAFAGFACTDLDGPADSNGERMTKYQRDLQARLLELQSKHDKVSIADIKKEAEEIRSKGAIEYLIKQIAGETTAKIAGKHTSGGTARWTSPHAHELCYERNSYGCYGNDGTNLCKRANEWLRRPSKPKLIFTALCGRRFARPRRRKRPEQSALWSNYGWADTQSSRLSIPQGICGSYRATGNV